MRPGFTLRVVVVHNRYRSENPSGENRVVESDIEQLRADGVEVIPYIRDSDEIDGFTPLGKAGLAIRPLVSPVDSLAFRRLLREAQPHIVHLHNPFPLISPWIVRTAKAQRVPVVQTVHNYRHVCVNGIHFRDGHLCTECVGKKVPWPAVQHGCYQGSRARSVPMAAALIAHRGTWDLVDRFLPVGEAVADHLRALGMEDERIEVRPNVVDDPGEPTEIGSGALFVGRLSPEKGVTMLIDAWRQSGLGALGETLTIAGDGQLRREVVAAATSDDSIRYLGLLDTDALGDAYRDCSLVVVPSLWSEADGIAAANGNAHGRAVLATDTGALPGSVANGSGWLVEPSVEKLATGLSAAFDSRDELTRRGTAGRSWYLETRVSHRRESLRSVYERILSSSPMPTIAGSGPSAVTSRPNDPDAQGSPTRQVAILTERVTHYREPFFNGLRETLQEKGVILRVLVATPRKPSAARGDEGDLEWVESVPTRRMQVGRRELVWHHCLRSLRSADLVVAEQASRLLTSHALLIGRYFGGPKVAWWGHGINLDREKSSRAGEAVKRKLAARADWWFCYTEGTASIVSDFGVDRQRITVVQNAVDTNGIRAARDRLCPDDIARVRRELGLGDGPVALWLSSIYDRKRPEFMVSAADHIRAELADFELLVIGDGPQRHVFDDAAPTRPWLHVLGARNGLDAVPTAATASILVNPGLVGLTVLDGFALGLPMITCDLIGHGPEVEYLENGVNGLVLSQHATPGDFAEACVRLLTDPQELGRLSDAARQASFQYTLEEMVERFTSGILQALESGRPRSVRRKLRNPFSRTERPDGEQV